MHNMNIKQGKVGYFMVKVDLEKSYDNLSWKYVQSVKRS